MIIREANPDYKCPTAPGLSTHAKTQRAQSSKPNRPARSRGVAGGVDRGSATGALPIPSTFTILSVLGSRTEPVGPQSLQSFDGSKTDHVIASGAVQDPVDTQQGVEDEPQRS